LEAPGRRLTIYRIKSPRVTNTIEIVEGQGEVLLLELGGSLKGELKSSLMNKDSRFGSKGEREEEEEEVKIGS
jgi:hypothetical protein